MACVECTVRAACGGVAAQKGCEQEEWLQAVHRDQPEQALKSMRWSRVLLAFHAAAFASAVYAGAYEFVLIVNCHCFFGNWLSYFVGECQHCGLCGSSPDFRMNTRSITLDPFTEFLFWRMNWHMEHHMFAGVPCSVQRWE